MRLGRGSYDGPSLRPSQHAQTRRALIKHHISVLEHAHLTVLMRLGRGSHDGPSLRPSRLAQTRRALIKHHISVLEHAHLTVQKN